MGLERFSDVVAYTWNHKVLFSALFELTYACNLDCYFCYNDRSLKGRPLTLDDYTRVLDELRELGTLNISLSGGEPLSHPHFFEIAAAARARNFVIRLKTNGHALRGKRLARVVSEVRPYRVEISLHGATAGTHDRQTRVPGSFDRLLSNLREATAAGLRVQLNSPVTRWNGDEVDDMLALAQELGCRIQFDTEISPRDDGDREPLSIAPTPDQVLAVARTQLRVSNGNTAAGAARPADASRTREASAFATENHCGAGSSVIAIDPVGNVLPCVQWRHVVGNVHDDSLVDLWNGGAFDGIRATTKAIKAMAAGADPDGPESAFCPGHALAFGGDATQIYESAVTRADAKRRVRLPVVG